MKRLSVALLTVLAATDLSAEPPAPAPLNPYEVVWTTPSADHNGTMPLGNGEIALNAWIEPSGDLRFYIARTDSWDDVARLVKLGSIRIRVGPPALAGDPAERTRTFRQTLTAKDATVRASYGQGKEKVNIRLWVDANRPVICVEVQTAQPSEARAIVELWRTEQTTLAKIECSDVLNGSKEKTIVEPDTVLTGLGDRVGWYHRNVKSVGPELCGKIQGMTGFNRPDPLLHRTFGCLVASSRPRRVDDRTLVSGAGTSHLFEIVAHTKHPAAAAQWQAEASELLDAARKVELSRRRSEHETWWGGFWNRSHIHIRSGKPAADGEVRGEGAIPSNKLPVRIGMDSHGGSRFAGQFGRVGIYETALSDVQIKALSATGPQAKAGELPGRLYSDVPKGPCVLDDLAGRTFDKGLTLEAWVKVGAKEGGRLVDKITVGGGDGFLLDFWPTNSLRLLVGRAGAFKKDVIKPDTWHHVAAAVSRGGGMTLYLDGKVLQAGSAHTSGEIEGGDDAAILTRAYALQRYVTACAGRGRYPIKFNGTLFTVPAEGGPGGPDYRRWGPGYWWQNTRLPYYAMCAAGDFDLIQPLFRMYAQDLFPQFQYRTRHYLGHGGIYIAECIYFWGDMFSETYGWQPFEQRSDKLQASGWHKWEWVSGLELAWLLLDYVEHTGDAEFFKQTALPVAMDVLCFFDEHYKTDARGKLYMHPSQALETWWDCVNPMPELAGLHAITARLLAMEASQVPPAQREFCKRLQAKLADLPTTKGPDGKVMLAPAEVFKQKRNVENPELYAVFPFRRFSFDKPHLDWALEALNRRLHRGWSGWRQDDIFNAYLGLADQARQYVVKRSRNKHSASRFPVFWGPNYDWTPDQTHGGVLCTAVQAMLMQTDGKTIHLLPAWPADWDADFKLCAPYRTVVEGRVRDGKLTELKVTPESRRADVKVHGK